MKLIITRDELKTLRAALHDAAEYEESFMDALRDKYSDEWKPMKTWERAYRKAENLRAKFKALRSKLCTVCPPRRRRKTDA